MSMTWRAMSSRPSTPVGVGGVSVSVLSRDGACVAMDGGANDGGGCCGLASLDAVMELEALDDVDVDAWLGARSGECGDAPNSYALLLLPAATNGPPGTAAAAASPAVVLGTHRHAWVRYPVPDQGTALPAAAAAAAAERAAAAAAPIALNYFASGGALTERPPPMPLQPDGGVLLSFTLANAAPNRSGHLYSWRFAADVERRFIFPAAAALARVATVRVEAQVLYHTLSRHAPVWDPALGAFTVAGPATYSHSSLLRLQRSNTI